MVSLEYQPPPEGLPNVSPLAARSALPFWRRFNVLAWAGGAVVFIGFLIGAIQNLVVAAGGPGSELAPAVQAVGTLLTGLGFFVAFIGLAIGP